MANEREQEKAIDLMIAYQSGSLEAFESLYRILYPTLLRYLMYQTFDRSRAEDLLQESFLQLHRSRRSYMPGRPVLPWACHHSPAITTRSGSGPAPRTG